MARNNILTVLLFLAGAAGSFLSVSGIRDGTALIVIGYGFSLMQLGIWNESNQGRRNKAALVIISLIVFILSAASVIYSRIKFNTGFNRVMSIGFIILQAWNMYNIFKNE